jgi:hypothetical protein
VRLTPKLILNGKLHVTFVFGKIGGHQMIQEGSRVVLQTDDAVYQTVEVINVNPKTITILYCKGTDWDKTEQRPVRQMKTEVIDRKKIISLCERW